MDKPTCKYCKSENMFTKEVGPHIGLYCKTCGKYQKWIPQNKLILYRNFGIYGEFDIHGTNYKV